MKRSVNLLFHGQVLLPHLSPSMWGQELVMAVGPYCQPITWPDAQLKNSSWHQCEKENWTIVKSPDTILTCTWTFKPWHVRRCNSSANEHMPSEFRSLYLGQTISWLSYILERVISFAWNASLPLSSTPTSLFILRIPTVWTTFFCKESTPRDSITEALVAQCSDTPSRENLSQECSQLTVSCYSNCRACSNIWSKAI